MSELVGRLRTKASERRDAAVYHDKQGNSAIAGTCEAEEDLIRAAADEIEKLRAALGEIAKGEGPFSRDRLTHATNTIEAMKEIARAALKEQEQ